MNEETTTETPTITEGFMKVQLILKTYTADERRRICDAAQIILDDGKECMDSEG